VELLVVIGIATLLLAMLMPALRNARGRGRQVICAANLRQLGQAYFLYASENRWAYPPYIVVWPVCAPDGLRYTWSCQIYRAGYCSDSDVFYCPEQTAEWSLARGEPVVPHPNAENSYGYNRWFDNMIPGGGPKPRIRINKVSTPSETCVLADCMFFVVNHNSDWQWWYHALPRHLNGINAVYMDTHVSCQSEDRFNANPYLHPLELE
jgi:prepilin-type processing-associated H-X9-DG protein